MGEFDNIANWVRKKPLALIRFDENDSESLNCSTKGFEHLTIARPHTTFQDFVTPTLCLLEVRDKRICKCYLGAITRKRVVTTFDSSLTIKKLRPLSISSLDDIEEILTDKFKKRLYRERVPVGGDFAKLTPGLSVAIVDALTRDPLNRPAFEVAQSMLPALRQAGHRIWAQEDAIQTAMAIFGLRLNAKADEVALKQSGASGLGLIGAYLYEDNVVHSDGSQIPGFDSIAPDITGRAVFTKGDERLVIYTANKLPLEQMLGVDLIYINEARGSIVMVQYKMMEPTNDSARNCDWIYRPDDQLEAEIQRMAIPPMGEECSSYRLDANPFLFKFVKRRIVDNDAQSLILSLDHLKQILASPASQGPKGGVRLSYEDLDGTYLREHDLIGLIRSGYIGTHKEQTTALEVIVSEVSRGNRALVMAWQKKFH